MTEDAWTEDRIEALKVAWGNGESAREIAARLGEPFTRNSVIGKARRLQLTARTNRRAYQDELAPVKPLQTIVDDLVPVPMESLKRDDCRWPIGDPHDDGFGFCGQLAKENSRYCEMHHARAYKPLV